MKSFESVSRFFPNLSGILSESPNRTGGMACIALKEGGEAEEMGVRRPLKTTFDMTTLKCRGVPLVPFLFL